MFCYRLLYNKGLKMKLHIIFYENKTEIQHILEFNLFSNWFSIVREHIKINPNFRAKIMRGNI